jgi:multiple sugar transport system substrate-binding protein
VIKKLAVSALAVGALLAAAVPVQAQQVVEWWDFLGGGDGVRMKTIIDDFNTSHEGAISIEGTTLDWGVPFYTKVQTSVAVNEAPDIMTYHASRIPLAVQEGILEEITPADWAALGLGESDFPADIWKAVTIDGKQYAVPMDTHPIVLYYNKDKLAAAGLLGDDGLPKGLNGVENFSAAMQKLQDMGTTWGMSTFTAAGDFQFRTIYSLMGQQDGEMLTGDEWLAGDNADKMQNSLQVLYDWVADGHVPPYTEYPAAIALFTSGESAFHINGVWEVPTMTDLYNKGELFEWGAVELPVFFNHPSTYSDSHTLAIPNNASADLSPEKRAAVLEIMKYVLSRGDYWATAGHIPALKSVTSSAAYQAMQPNATYAVLTSNMIYDPKTPLAGIAGPMYAVTADVFTAVVNGEMDPVEAVDILKEDLNNL